MTTHFDEDDHPRADGGQFTSKPRRAPETALSPDHPAAHDALMEENADLPDFTGPLERVSLHSSAHSVNHFTHPDQRPLFDLNPPYQRGSVWDEGRRRNLIRSMLLGIPVGAIVVNDGDSASATDAPYTVIDGKQRIETLRAWSDGHLLIPAEWIPVEDRNPGAEEEVDGWPAPGIRSTGLTLSARRIFGQQPVAIVSTQHKSVAEQAEIFRLINSGGVPQTEETLAAAAAVERA